ncbi:hypothetical protein [Methylobacterium oxalidis]|uniref:Uncharacterized protein n=1 Tax=Methylobacterium oxalidis TaxID=944322 RepID=A0A512J4Y3_9HYPH|nr:hypothetical protein [Methylobacterium oxalidis]GEP05021.1 hypothetical protein MOX02_30590 [Methylobacterium oxalidis]GJE33381.1 hypothetical protein LDDCCGHA_3581 [Methylobacterium oxalidis]GLS65700.1 hypothetical protein GCM10007888_40820 [Methylobacterium oxalidis]
MLAVLVSNISRPVEEPLDRDPGVLTLAAAIVRAVRREHEAAFARRCAQARSSGVDAAFR